MKDTNVSVKTKSRQHKLMRVFHIDMEPAIQQKFRWVYFGALASPNIKIDIQGDKQRLYLVGQLNGRQINTPMIYDETVIISNRYVREILRMSVSQAAV